MMNRGIFNEVKIAESLNGKKITRLPENFKKIIEVMFGVVNPLRRIKVYQTKNYIKPDLVFEYKGVKHFVSVKSGKSTNLHTEQLNTFIGFLRECGIPEKVLKTIVLLHYGDGTFDGSGPVRYDYHELYVRYQKLIDEANHELNKSVDFINKFLGRIMFDGVNPNADSAEFIYFGELEEGTFVSRAQVEKYIQRKPHNWKFYDNIHIGPIVLRPHARYAHSEIRNEASRHEIQCNWPKLHEDLMYISKRYGY